MMFERNLYVFCQYYNSITWRK